MMMSVTTLIIHRNKGDKKKGMILSSLQPHMWWNWGMLLRSWIQENI